MGTTFRSQDDLVDIFARSMSLTARNPSAPQQQFAFPSDRSTSVVYASTHYYQPTYAADSCTPASNETPYAGHTNTHHPGSSEAHHHYNTFATIPVPGTDASTEFTLRQNDIDPHFLFPCQIALFRTADSGQRLRLLEIWRTAPLRAGDKEAVSYRYGDLHTTNLLQEEVMARLRLERRVAESNCVASQRMEEAEPYMVSGYTEKEKDAIFTDSAGLWESPPPSYEQSMEDQYGALMAARDFERFQELHEQVQGSQSMMDDEMMV
ncbi:hypothetical protein CAC42_9 [Sphaceloma murrayae]|uniref:Uncharacterized protein n=1 Tax=Sphaceloma murrayae TaxID=2082308 RepID=A0A2K1QS20_9PEZI|nr:hypothetical protein CAC42_9 [Sphaceloma murrayae]